MSTPTPSQPPAENAFFDFPEGHEPRRGRLLASGIILGVIGCLLGLLACLYLFVLPFWFGSLPTGSTGGDEMGFLKSSMIMAGLYIGILCLAFVVTGAGSVFLKRWSRPLALFLATTWTYLGLFYLAYSVIFAGDLRREMNSQMDAAMAEAATAGAPTGVPSASAQTDSFFGIFLVIGMAAIFVFGICLPALILWLNWHRDVRVTLEFCDRRERWTDRCPLPLLGLVFACLFSAVSLIPSFFQATVPAFGRFVFGIPAQATLAVICLLLLAIAGGLYRRHLAAWIALVLLVVLGVTSGIMTSFQGDYREVYRHMGMPEEMIEQSTNALSQVWQTPRAVILGAVFALPPLVYLFWCLRFLRSSPTAPGTAIPGE